MKHQLTVDIPDDAWRRLTELGATLGLEPAGLVQVLLDHVDQGIWRPGSWERRWLEQLLGDRAVEAAWLVWAAGEAAAKELE